MTEQATNKWTVEYVGRASRPLRCRPAVNRFRRWRHSLSVSLTIVGIILCVVSVFCEPGHAPYDFFMNLGTGLLLGAIFAVAYRYTWEEGSDPTDPPEE